jgi:hypothetical protein
MNSNNDEDSAITKRILLKEQNIRKLTTKYLEFKTKFNSYTRNEMISILNEILNEIELIEISLLKTENIKQLKLLDREYNIKRASKITDKTSQLLTEITQCKDKLRSSEEHKQYQIQCEQIAKKVNQYDSLDVIGMKIAALNEDNQSIIAKTEKINQTMKAHVTRIEEMISILNAIKSSKDNDIEISIDETK